MQVARIKCREKFVARIKRNPHPNLTHRCEDEIETDLVKQKEKQYEARQKYQSLYPQKIALSALFWWQRFFSRPLPPRVLRLRHSFTDYE
jgi:hypothetical protein